MSSSLARVFPADRMIAGRGQREYLIHDNGGRPFSVIVTGRTITIYKKRRHGHLYNVVVVPPTRCLKIWIGKDAQHPGRDFQGTSVLAQLSSRKYLFVGSTIFTFLSADPIIGFCSYVGRNDTPYPWAVGTRDTFILLHGIRVPNDEVQGRDPYPLLYDHQLPSATRFRTIVIQNRVEDDD